MARTSQRPPHVGTIGEDRRRNMTLRIFCLKHSCRHNAKADLDAHCARYGDGMPVSVFVALSRCSRCGARWPDLAITVTPDSPQVVSHGKSGRVQPPRLT
jgi:hypothetical protein